jgi:hypothetical protein
MFVLVKIIIQCQIECLYKKKCMCYQTLSTECNMHFPTPPIHVGRPGRDRMVMGYTTTYAISAYQH